MISYFPKLWTQVGNFLASSWNRQMEVFNSVLVEKSNFFQATSHDQNITIKASELIFFDGWESLESWETYFSTDRCKKSDENIA